MVVVIRWPTVWSDRDQNFVPSSPGLVQGCPLCTGELQPRGSLAPEYFTDRAHYPGCFHAPKSLPGIFSARCSSDADPLRTAHGQVLIRAI